MAKTRTDDPEGDTGSLQRVYRKHELPPLTGYSWHRLRELIREGKFPAPYKLGGGRAVGWTQTQILKWQRGVFGERDEGAS